VRDPKLDWESLIEAQRPLAEKEVRSAFVLGKIAESEKIEVSDQEVEADIEDMAAASGKSVEAVRANLTKENALDSIKEQIHLRKALDFVISSASITVEEATEPISAEEGEQPTQASVSE
jgi:trigger factor